MQKPVKVALIVVVVSLVGIQLIRPDRTNPPVDAGHTINNQLQTPPEVTRILERSCHDCHSNQTTWPWYSNVAPVSWLVADDVSEGREHMNFSEWSQYDRAEAADLVGNICKWTSRGKMPLPSYLLIHRDAKLSPQDVKALCDWSQETRQRLAMESH
jgi:hypothetical protein